MKRLFLIFLWFGVSFSLFAVNSSAVYLMRRKTPISQSFSSTQAVTSPNVLGIEDASLGIAGTIQKEDARVEILASFLERHTSPLKPYERYARSLVEIADRYDIDYRLLPAIMMQESNVCKAIPPGSNNCLGFGIHERGTLTFPTYEEGFDRAARELKKNYIDQGLNTPEKIMKKYTPSSNGSWANSVNQWIAEMEYNDRDMGRDMKSDADLLEYVK